MMRPGIARPGGVIVPAARPATRSSASSGLPAVMSPLTQSTITPFSAMALLVPRRLPQPRLKPWLSTISAEAWPWGKYQSAL